jgi:metalloendopeptidase OMA1, mitochondrial
VKFPGQVSTVLRKIPDEVNCFKKYSKQIAAKILQCGRWVQFSFGVNKMRRLLFLSIFVIFTSCASTRVPVPVGTVPMAVAPSRAEKHEGLQARGAILRDLPLETSPVQVERVKRITARLIEAAYSNDPWSVYILKSPIWNAFTTQGNFIYIFTGLLEDLKDDEQVAAVISHELAHNLARHVVPTREEMFNQVLSSIAAAAVGIAIGQEGNPRLADSGAQLTHQVVKGFIVNPQSQRNENEADHIGLFLMADAGFNPEKALTIWNEKAKEHGHSPGLTFFSSHPASAARSENLEKLLPEARLRYMSAKKRDQSRSIDSRLVRMNPGAKNYSSSSSDLSVRALREANHYYSRREFSTALSKYKEAIAYDQNNIDAYQGLALVYFQLGQLSDAKATLQTIIGKDSRNALAHYNLACMHSLSGEESQALDNLEAAVKLDRSFISTAKEDRDFFTLRDNPRFRRITAGS